MFAFMHSAYVDEIGVVYGSKYDFKISLEEETNF